MSDDAPKRVVVVGAGPAGLLAAIMLLRRNLNGPSARYQVTLVDPGVNFGMLDETGLAKHRSWMIGLSAHGLNAVQQVPNLYTDYVEKLGAKVTKATIGLGPKWNITQDWDPTLPGFCVDRNYVCAALAKYLMDHFGSDVLYSPMFETKALFVDAANKIVMIRSNDKADQMVPLPYDILLGCDGIRSVVRNAFITNHRDFEFDIEGAFGTYKSLHLTLPSTMDEGNFMFLLNCLPNMGAFVLPERGWKLNVALGWNLNAKVDPSLYSDNPATVEAYVRKHFKSFDIDYAEFAEQWTNQDLQTTQMVHCSFYHSTRVQAILMGDAAHATVPNIGQGMNTALADAGALETLLDEHSDDWEKVLPAYSKERVKEGNALTELSYHTFSIDPSMMISIAVRQTIHRALNKLLPTGILELEPMLQVSKGMALSLAYDKMTRYGYMAKSRQKNQGIKRAYFEKKVGMVQEKSFSVCPSLMWATTTVTVLAIAFSVLQSRKY